MVVASQQPQSASQSENLHSRDQWSRSAHQQSPAEPELPPSERDLEVFEELAAQGLSTRQVAARHRISQTRVMQIGRKVALWMATLPGEGDLTPVERIRAAAQIAEMQTDHLYGEAMRAWTASQQPQAECRGAPGSQTQTLRSRHGDWRFLMAAMRIAERRFQVVVQGQKAIANAIEREKTEQWEADFDKQFEDREGEAPAEPRAAKRRHRDNTPPVRECSLPPDSAEAHAQPGADQSDASAVQPGTYEEAEARCLELIEALTALGAPVQPPGLEAGAVQPETTQVGQPLNRHERRRRERLLQRAKRKAK